MAKVTWLLGTMVLFLTAGLAQSEETYPSRPIRLIVPFAPGGGVDIVARFISDKLKQSFKTPVVVDNRSGAAGAIGTEIAIKASPDGYTLIAVEGGYAGNAAAFKLPYDPLKDITPIALIAETGFIVAVHPSLPVQTVNELIAYDKGNQGKTYYGSGGTGSVNHLVVELFNQLAGTTFTHVPYKGVGQALTDLLGGHIQLIIGGMPPMLPHLKSHRLRGLAVTNANRSPVANDLPTVAESVPGYEAMQWFAILGPRGLPQDVVTLWNREIDRLMATPEARQRMVEEGLEPAGGAPERFADVLARDIAKWQRVATIARINPVR